MKPIDHSLSMSDDDRLYVDECAVSDLADQFGTPLYVISEKQLRENARRFQSAFGDRWREGDVTVMPAIKANYNLALRHILTDEGCGCDIFSEGELWAATKGGVDPAKSSLNGNGKVGFGNNLLRTAIERGVRITIDDAVEFEPIEKISEELGKKANVRVRLRPEYPGLTEPTDFLVDKIPTDLATQVYKSGIPMEDLIPLGKKIFASPHMELTGIHIHQGRHSRDLEFWKATMEGLAKALGYLKEQWNGWEPTDIDIGGGFPVPRDPLGREIHRSSWFMTRLLSAGVNIGGLFNARNRVTQAFLNMSHADHDSVGPDPMADLSPAIEEYAEVITSTLRSELVKNGLTSAGKNLEIEPGRGLYGDAGIHVARVTFVKRQTHPLKLTWVNTDTSEAFLGDVIAEHSRFRYMLADKPIGDLPPEEVMTADLVGCSCSGDRIVGDARLPADVEAGDVVTFLDTGAYQDSSANNFNALPRPSTVLVNGSVAEVIKRRETYDDVFGRDSVPERLQTGSAP